MHYTDRDTAPLKFHRFNGYFLLPLGILTCFFDAKNEISAIDKLTWLHILDLVYYFSVIILMLVAFIGFLNWKKYGLHCFFVNLYIGIIYTAICVTLYLVLDPSLSSITIAVLICRIIYAYIARRYYFAREGLFME